MARTGADGVIYFDGACPLCRREVAHYRRLDGAASLDWVDASSCDASALGSDLSRAAALARLHARRVDGSLVSGVEAFAIIWSRLPAYRWLAGIASRRPVLAVLEIAYAAFLRLRPLWRGAQPASGARPVPVVAELRSSHAGESGAVQIYRGILAVTRDGELRAFASRHLATEARHLEQIEQWLPASSYSRLLPLWKAAGWVTGALPSLFGARAVYVTVAAVEHFVDRHYAAQIELLSSSPPLADLQRTLRECRAEEIAHRDEALARMAVPQGLMARAWSALVGTGSAMAVMASRRL